MFRQRSNSPTVQWFISASLYKDPLRTGFTGSTELTSSVSTLGLSCSVSGPSEIQAFLFTGTLSLICLLTPSSLLGLVNTNLSPLFAHTATPSRVTKILWAASAEWELPECQALLLGYWPNPGESTGYSPHTPDASLAASDPWDWNGNDSDSEYVLRVRGKILIDARQDWSVEGVKENDDGRETCGLGWKRLVFLHLMLSVFHPSPPTSFCFADSPYLSSPLFSLLIHRFLFLAKASSSFISSLWTSSVIWLTWSKRDSIALTQGSRRSRWGWTSNPGTETNESSDLIERAEDSGRGDENEEEREGEWGEERVEDRVERQDSCEDLEGGMSIPSNFTLCLN